MSESSSRPRSRSPKPRAGRRTSELLQRRELKRVLRQHDETDARWLDYEIDVAKLLDFPLMTDMRNPLTTEFHKARRRADLLRPENVDDIVGDREAQLEYRDAVHDYVTAFDVAEAEAIRLAPQRLHRRGPTANRPGPEPAPPGRRRRGDAQERQSAYARAQLELDGHLALAGTDHDRGPLRLGEVHLAAGGPGSVVGAGHRGRTTPGASPSSFLLRRSTYLSTHCPRQRRRLVRCNRDWGFSAGRYPRSTYYRRLSRSHARWSTSCTRRPRATPTRPRSMTVPSNSPTAS